MPLNSLASMAMNNIIWVENEQHAKNYPVAFGHSVLFMDKNEEKLYIKTVDQSGVMTAFRRFERVELADPIPENFVSKTEFEELQNKIDLLTTQLQNALKEKEAPTQPSIPQSPKPVNNYKNQQRRPQ